MRWLSHLLTTRGALNRAFPKNTLDAIEEAITRGEHGHRGEIRFAIESALDLPMLMRGISVRERALEVFSHLAVWDTEENNGVLVYVLLAEHAVEVVADRGFKEHVAPDQWQQVCSSMIAAFRENQFHEGAITGIETISRLIGSVFPGEDRANELPNRPTIL